MNIEDRHLKIVKTILSQYQFTFYAFGSRVSGNNQFLSDLDICFFEDIQDSLIFKLEEEFEESDLPYKVDLVDWNSCNKEFQDIILKNMHRIQQGRKFLKFKHNGK